MSFVRLGLGGEDERVDGPVNAIKASIGLKAHACSTGRANSEPRTQRAQLPTPVFHNRSLHISQSIQRNLAKMQASMFQSSGLPSTRRCWLQVQLVCLMRYYDCAPTAIIDSAMNWSDWLLISLESDTSQRPPLEDQLSCPGLSQLKLHDTCRYPLVIMFRSDHYRSMTVYETN